MAFLRGKLTTAFFIESSFSKTLSILAAQAAQVIPSTERVKGFCSFDKGVTMIIKQRP